MRYTVQQSDRRSLAPDHDSPITSSSTVRMTVTPKKKMEISSPWILYYSPEIPLRVWEPAIILSLDLVLVHGNRKIDGQSRYIIVRFLRWLPLSH